MLDANALLGAHEIRVTRVDAAGSTSATLAAAVAVTDDDGAPGGPTVDTVEPSAAAAGDVVQISGTGFEARGLTVEVGSAAAQLLDIASDRVTFVMPDVDRAAAWCPHGPKGWRVGRADPRVTLHIVPPEFEIHEGGEIQLVALVTGTADQPRHLDGRSQPGDDRPDRAADGRVRRAGGPDRGDGDLRRVARFRRCRHRPRRPMPPREGPVAVGATGGIVLDGTGGLRLTVPRGALGEPATIELRNVPVGSASPTGAWPRKQWSSRPDTSSPDRRGWRSHCVSGTTPVPASPSGITWTRETRGRTPEKPAIVDETGFLARLELTRFGVIRLDKPFPMFDVIVSPLPAITGIVPPIIEEGATVALLVTGKNFVPGFTSVVALDANLAPDLRMEVPGSR